MKENPLIINAAADRYTVTDKNGTIIQTFEDGDRCQLEIGGKWEAVTVRGGGYRGWYYETVAGERGRFGLCTKVRSALHIEKGGATDGLQ